MEEFDEKELATRFAAALDKALAASGTDPRDLPPDAADALETALFIGAATGGAQAGLPEPFDSTLRARLSRAATPPRRRPFFISQRAQMAVAAAIFIIMIPSLYLVRDVQERGKLQLVEKYDKMYVPFSQTERAAGYLEKQLRPFDQDHAASMQDMLIETRGAGSDFFTRYPKPGEARQQ